MDIEERFLKYVSIDTQSDEYSDTTPSTLKQLDLGKELVKEMLELGITDAHLDEYGIVYGTIKGNGGTGDIIGFIAHMDTSPDASGTNIKPQKINNYDGSIIEINKELGLSLDPEEFVSLKKMVGHDLITTDGTTLLGADDKAGVAIIMDLANYYAREASDETLLLKLLYQTFRALVNTRIPNQLIRYIYELKVISINGEGPQVFECIGCGDREQGKVFSIRRGGLLCRQCAAHVTDGRKLSASTLYAMQYIIASPVEKLYTFLVKEDVLKELGDVVTAYMAEYLGKSFKSLEILETLIM